MRKFTEQEGEFVKQFAFGHSYREITEELNRRFHSDLRVDQVRAYLKWHKIKTGRTGQFTKGIVPQNQLPVGAEVLRGQYLFVKVGEPSVWKEKHIVVWEEHYGAVPKGKCIIFLDGDVRNTDIENLAMVDLRINMMLNRRRLRQNYKEGTLAAIETVNLLQRITDIEKEKQNTNFR